MYSSGVLSIEGQGQPFLGRNRGDVVVFDDGTDAQSLVLLMIRACPDRRRAVILQKPGMAGEVALGVIRCGPRS